MIRAVVSDRLGHRTFASVADILKQIESGSLSAKDAEPMLSKISMPTPDESVRSFANLDHSRANRTGFPEAVFAEGKTAPQVAAILDDMALNVNKMVEANGIEELSGTAILATR